MARTVSVDVGNIPFLKAGSIWEDGVQISPAAVQKTRSAVLSHGDMDLVQLDAASTSPNGAELRLTYRGSKLRVPRVSNLCAATLRQIGTPWVLVGEGQVSPGRSILIVLPCVVLFQAAFASSAATARYLMLHGHSLAGLIKRHPPSPGSPRGSVALELRPGLQPSEAATLAHIDEDPVAQQAWKAMRAGLVVQRANHHGPSRLQLQLELSFPYTHPASIEFVGSYLLFRAKQGAARKTIPAYLVHEIRKIDVQLVFSKLEIVQIKCTRDDTSGTGSSDARMIVKRQPAAFDPAVLPVTSMRPPGAHLERSTIGVFGAMQPRGLDIVSSKRELAGSRRTTVIAPVGTPSDGTASTEERSGSGGTAPLDVELEPETPLPEAFDDLFAALKQLDGSGHISMKGIGVSPPSMQASHGTHAVNYFSRVNARRARSWRRMSRSPGSRTRRFVAAEGWRNNFWWYLIDIEHKRPNELSLLLVRDMHGQRITAAALASFLEVVAAENGWGATMHYRSQWRFENINHTRMRGVAALVKAIKAATA